MSRQIMRIELTGPAKKKLSTLSDKHGMTQVAMMSRVVEWFAGQDNTTQLGVVGAQNEVASGTSRRIIERMAARK